MLKIILYKINIVVKSVFVVMKFIMIYELLFVVVRCCFFLMLCLFLCKDFVKMVDIKFYDILGVNKNFFEGEIKKVICLYI